MPTTAHHRKAKIPGRFTSLVRRMPPRAIADDVQLEATIGVIDRIMAAGELTQGQRIYLETLVQLVEAYERAHHSIGPRTGIPLLKFLLAENSLSAADLSRILGIHASMGSKILKGERSLTVEHLKTLSARFKIRPEALMG